MVTNIQADYHIIIILRVGGGVGKGHGNISSANLCRFVDRAVAIQTHFLDQVPAAIPCGNRKFQRNAGQLRAHGIAGASEIKVQVLIFRTIKTPVAVGINNGFPGQFRRQNACPKGGAGTPGRAMMVKTSRCANPPPLGNGQIKIGLAGIIGIDIMILIVPVAFIKCLNADHLIDRIVSELKMVEFGSKIILPPRMIIRGEAFRVVA